MSTLRGWILKVDFAVLFVQMRKDTINVQSRGYIWVLQRDRERKEGFVMQMDVFLCTLGSSDSRFSDGDLSLEEPAGPLRPGALRVLTAFALLTSALLLVLL